MRKGLIASVAATGAAVLVLGTAWAQGPSYDHRYVWDHHMMWSGGYGMIFGPLFMTIFLAVLVGAAVLFARWIAGPGPATPLDILKERYARGEIDKTEFEDRRKTLGV